MTQDSTQERGVKMLVEALPTGRPEEWPSGQRQCPGGQWW